MSGTDFKSRMKELILVSEKVYLKFPIPCGNDVYVDAYLHKHETNGFVLEMITEKLPVRKSVYRVAFKDAKLTKHHLVETPVFFLSIIELVNQCCNVPNMIHALDMSYQKKQSTRKLMQKAYERYKQEKEERLGIYFVEEQQEQPRRIYENKNTQ